MTNIPYWNPGKLYQVGEFVLPNAGNLVSQVALTNNGFESGDTGWTKGNRFSIGAGTAFKGSNRARFAADSGSLVAIATDTSNIPHRTTDGVNFSTSAAVTGLLLAGGPGVLVAINTTTVETSNDGGATWVAQTPPANWTGGKEFIIYLATVGLFMVGFSGSTKYFTSADGVSWTERTFPATFTSAPTTDQTNYATDGTNEVIMLTNGNVYTSTNGTSWTSRGNIFSTSGNGLAYASSLGAFYAAGVVAGTTTLKKSTDGGATWAEVASNDLDANITGTPRLAYSPTGGVLVAHVNSSGSSANSTITATSTNGVNWTTRSAYQGRYMRYSSTLDKFVLFGQNKIAHSADGITWAQNNYSANTFNVVNYPSADKSASAALSTLTNNDRKAVFAGQIIEATCKVQTSATGVAQIGIAWYNSGGTLLKVDYGTSLTGASTAWREVEVSAIAPLNAATASAVLAGSGTGEVLYDEVQWSYFTQADHDCFIYEMTAAAAGFSSSIEPVWPEVVTNTVNDGGCVWTCRVANCVEWQAKPILLSGASEPTWPTEEGAVVEDNTILWTARSGRVLDVNCPNTKQVAILSSKIFAGDDDIVSFCATVNPLDWSSKDDAGFIPFGLNTYGSEPVSALGIYRSNLVIWNSKAFQMWQVDADPQNFAILDAVPVGNRFYRSGTPVANDLVWVTDEGIRNMGIAGASTNLQAGFFGKQIDPLVKAAIAALADTDDIMALYYPGAGQAWFIFDDEAFVLTMNGGKSDMSWSRYVFPSAIDDWTLVDSQLYLRSGDKVWLFDPSAVRDDVGGSNVIFEGRVWWPYLDFGVIGVTKSLIGFDVVCDGEFTINIGYDQTNIAIETTDYTLSGDTLTGDVIPLPVTAPSMQLRLTFTGDEAWEWQAAVLYLDDQRPGA